MAAPEFFLHRAARSFDVDDAGWHVFLAHHFAGCPDNLWPLTRVLPVTVTDVAERILFVEGASR